MDGGEVFAVITTLVICSLVIASIVFGGISSNAIQIAEWIIIAAFFLAVFLMFIGQANR